MKPLNVLGGLNAMISLDIYKSTNSDLDDISNVIEADLVVIVSNQDHLVNPISATILAEKLGAQLVTLTGDCGHRAFICEAETGARTVISAITQVLEDDEIRKGKEGREVVYRLAEEPAD